MQDTLFWLSRNIDVSSQTKNDSVQDLSDTNREHSTTNNQVANVDEADIVKTDGNYIYYVANNKVYIASANKLDLLSTIEIAETDSERFYPTEIFINKDKLIVLGTHYIYEYEENIFEKEYYDYGYYSSSKSRTKVMVYNMKDKKEKSEKTIENANNKKYINVATGTTGTLVMGETGLKITRMKSGPLGGDQQIGAMLANGELHLIIFLKITFFLLLSSVANGF